MSDRKLDKLAFFLPNTFTALNMGCGFMGILYAFQGEFYKACMFIIIGALFDSVDGRVARMTGTQSSFGEQFDSLSDLISFGVAPALIFYFKFLAGMDRFGMVVAFIYLLCGALRLARFNANIDKVSSDYFQGLPIPAAASAVIGYILFSMEVSHLPYLNYIAAPYLIFYAVLMISNIPFTSFKNAAWFKANKRKLLFLIFILISTLFVYEEVMIFSIISLYVLGCIIYRITHRNKFQEIFNWEDSQEENEANETN